MSLPLRPPPDAPPLVALQTDRGVEMSEYCFLATPSHGTHIADPAHSHEFNVLIALCDLRGVPISLLLPDGLKPLQYPL
jgi:hypothetical protein